MSTDRHNLKMGMTNNGGTSEACSTAIAVAVVFLISRRLYGHLKALRFMFVMLLYHDIFQQNGHAMLGRKHYLNRIKKHKKPLK